MTGCLPHMKPLVSHYTPAWLRRFLRSTITTIKTGSNGKSGASKYFSSRSAGTSSKGNVERRLGGENEDSIELTAPEEDLERAPTNISLSDNPRPSGPRVSRPTIATLHNDRKLKAAALPVLSPGQIVVTKEVRLERI